MKTMKITVKYAMASTNLDVSTNGRLVANSITYRASSTFDDEIDYGEFGEYDVDDGDEVNDHGCKAFSTLMIISTLEVIVTLVALNVEQQL